MKQRKRGLWCLVLSLCLMLGLLSLQPQQVQAAGSTPALSSRAAYLWDITDNKVLYQKNANTRYANASTTKMLTGILALEKLKPNTVVTFSDYAASIEPTKLWAQAGESFYMKDLLYSLLVPSHNDTAVALAEKIAGSEQAFAGLMNQKAAAIGCKNTYFLTASGLDVDGGSHGSSARDLALILNYGIKNPTFLDAISISSKTIRPINQDKNYYLYTTSPEFKEMQGAVGGKTGYTSKAGQCFAGLYERQGHRYIAVVLGAPTSAARWQDMEALMHYSDKLAKEQQTRRVTLTWEPVEEAEGYTIWYKRNGASSYTRAGITHTNTFTMKNLKPGDTYRFSVKSWVKEDGKYIFGPLCYQTDGAVKPEPARIREVTVNENGDVKVRLMGTARGAQKYAMCYSTSRDYSNWNFKVGIRTIYTTRTMVKNLDPGTYYVRVRSYVELKDKTRVYASWSPAYQIVVD